MNRKATAVVIALGVAFVVAVLIPPQSDDPGQFLPWHIEPTSDGNSRVFGITVGGSSLAEVVRRVGEAPQLNLFAASDGTKNVEAYFDAIRLGGLSAKMVVNLDVPESRLEQMYENGARISTLGSGARKVDLRPEDRDWLQEATVTAITYIPAVRLDGALIRGRFGEPDARVQEEGGAEHWLYPELGLDVALGEKERGVLLYVPPRRFEEVVAPLRELESQPIPG